MLVAALVIYNTFNILVAQRTREMALLRCIGATRGQVFGSIVLESAVVGLLVVGARPARRLRPGRGRARPCSPRPTRRCPTAAVALTPAHDRSSAWCIGLLVTVGAALLPARAATRVAPIAALRTQVEEHTFRTGVVRVIFAALFLLVGLGAARRPGAGAWSPDEVALLVVMAGGALVFLAVLILGPVIVKPLSALGRLAARQALRGAGQARRGQLPAQPQAGRDHDRRAHRRRDADDADLGGHRHRRG